MPNHLSDAQIALEESLNVLKKFDSSTLRALPESDRLTFALAEATVAVGCSWLEIAKRCATDL